MVFNMQKKEYSEAQGSVRYLDGTALKRPFRMPKQAIALMILFVIVAMIIGGIALYNVLDKVLNEPVRQQARLEQTLSRNVALDLPPMASFMSLDDATIKQQLTDSGFIVYQTSTEEDYPDGGFSLIKLPSDVSLEEAEALYAQGINKIPSIDAARLLKGSWTLSVNRKDFTEIRVRYADFDSGSIDNAIQNALVAEGFDSSFLGETGTDEAGNTFQAGTIEVDGTFYSWRVSVIELDAIYNIAGFPDTAVYVGIRMTP